MRCKNCGWPNRPDELNCSKCGSLLESGFSGVEKNETSSGSNLTVRENEIFGQVSQPNICFKCGYPLRPGLQKCPNCNSVVGEIAKNEEIIRRVVQPVRHPTVIGVPSINGTVNVWTEGPIGVIPSFILSPIKRNGERRQPEDIEYEGESVTLNRDNTDPGNLSITSRQQAVITRKDDKWYIEDKSDQKSTFVQVSTPHELHDGDIILLGNRLFIFHE